MAFVQVRFVKVSFVAMRFVNWPVVAKRLIPVAFVKFRVVTVDDPAEKFPVRFKVVPDPFVNVKFWRVV